MTIDIILVLLGLLMVIYGADILVDGASAIARKAGISEFVIGLTIVGFGTSCPELVVSLTGALEGNADISIGNVVGSNIFNTMLILGLTALLMPVGVTAQNKHRDIPVMLLVTFLFIALGMSKTLLGIGDADSLSQIEGIVFLVLFISYMILCFKTDKGSVDEPAADRKELGLAAAILLTIGGLALLIFGGDFFVDHSVSLAHRLGVSDKFIAITLLAGGTSFPELVTCIVAAAKKKGQLALGNILGSNVFNILLILGCSAAITPLSLSAMTIVDMGVLALSAVLVWMSSYTFKKDRIDRYEGAIFLAAFVLYYVFLFKQL